MKDSAFWKHVFRSKSPYRALMNRALFETGAWDGQILDIGGIRRNGQGTGCPRLSPGASVLYLNIDPDAKPDILTDAAEIPLADASLDNVWCLNTLEHVRDPIRVFHEAVRVLKPGGRIAVAVPFLYRIHADPDDYWRFTASVLRDMATHEALDDVAVQELGGGPFLAAASLAQSVLPNVIFIPFLACARIGDRCVGWIRPGRMREWPLGYVLVGRKKD